jgi:hypothetical protein
MLAESSQKQGENDTKTDPDQQRLLATSATPADASTSRFWRCYHCARER